MEYINHINKYDNSAAIQAALDAGTLANPYVAMDSAGTLDFNSLQPTPPPDPIIIGTWSEDTNSFTITEDDYQTYWVNPVYIGKFNGVYYVEGEEQSEIQPINMDLYLYYDGFALNFTLRDENDPTRFDTPSGSFELDQIAIRTPFEHTYTDPEGINPVFINWDNGVRGFSFLSRNTLSVTKHNPEYPQESAGE